MPKIARPPGTVRFHDAGISVWEEPGGRHGLPTGYEKGFQHDVLHGLIRLMRQRKWRVFQDADIVKNYNCLKDGRRRAKHFCCLEARIAMSGRHLEITFYQEVKRPKDGNPNGGEYDYNRLAGMPYLMRKRCELEMDHIAGWLIHMCGYAYKPERQPCSVFGVDVDTWLEQRSKEAHWHSYKRAIDDPKPVEKYNSKCLDGHVQNGERVYFLGGYVEQRWGVGIAEHNINNMWWVKIGTHEVRNVASHHLSHAIPEGGLRGRKILDWRRKERLEKLMLKAAKEQRYLDAERMRVALERRRYEATTP